MLKKKWSLFILLLGFVLFLAACSDDAEDLSDASDEDSPAKTALHVSGDVVEEKAGCVLKSQFTVGDLIVWRMDVTDPETMEQVSPEDTEVNVHLSTGEVLEMRYGPHPAGEEGAPEFWTTSIPVTEDTPTGVLEYYVTAESGDKKGEFRPFNVAPSLLTINEPGEEAADEEAGEEEEEEGNEGEDVSNVETNQTIDLIATDFAFADENGEDIFYVKAGEEVTLNLVNEEGMHGIMIPDLDVRLDEDGTVTFTPEEPGEYELLCSIFCGSGHSDMTASVVVVD